MNIDNTIKTKLMELHTILMDNELTFEEKGFAAHILFEKGLEKIELGKRIDLDGEARDMIRVALTNHYNSQKL